MTLENLKEIFKFQTTATEDHVPSGTLDFVMIDPLAQSKLKKTHSADNIEALLPLLEGFELDAYFDKTPVFIKPEKIIVL
jgi:hypothetical protein